MGVSPTIEGATSGGVSEAMPPSPGPAADELLEPVGGVFGPPTLAETLIRPGAYWFFHHMRFFGYLYWLPPLLALRPRSTSIGLAAYTCVHRQEWWQKAVHRFCGFGASRRHRVVNENHHLLKPDQRYLWCIHPHSFLADGWHSIIARNTDSFHQASCGPPEIGRKLALCFAPIVKHVPVHQEMYRNNCDSADLKSITRWWTETSDTDPALIPGGFAEACFASADDKDAEYAYIKDRTGFVKISIQNGVDMVPMYTFGASRMYSQPRLCRGARAKFSQNYFIGLVLHFGKWWTAMPLTDETTTVVFPPFEASKYTIDQLDEAHAAYLDHLKTHFDANKAKYGMAGVELVFVGKDWEDHDGLATALRKVGIMKNIAPRSRL